MGRGSAFHLTCTNITEGGVSYNGIAMAASLLRGRYIPLAGRHGNRGYQVYLLLGSVAMWEAGHSMASYSDDGYEPSKNASVA